MCGVAASNWLVRIPAIKSELGARALRLALLGTPLGWLVAQLGSRPVTLAMAVCLCLALPFPTLAPRLLVLPLALFVLGGFLGALDVAMDAQAAKVERWNGRPIMSSFHAAYSNGGVIGAALGGAAAGAGLSPAVHLSTVAAVLLAASALACRWLLPRETEGAFRGTGFAWPGRALAALGFLAFGALLAEGPIAEAIADWSAVYLHETVGTDPG
ncbi:Inner membrane protein YbjJ [bacterium HR27]|nr:Inner membrane protein YbjJ [bacterium HR27]